MKKHADNKISVIVDMREFKVVGYRPFPGMKAIPHNVSIPVNARLQEVCYRSGPIT